METQVVSAEPRSVTTIKRIVVGVPLLALVIWAVTQPIVLMCLLVLVAVPIALIELINLSSIGVVPQWLREKLRLPNPKRLARREVLWQTGILVSGIAVFVHTDFQSVPWAVLILMNIVATDACAYWVGSLTARAYRMVQRDVPEGKQKKPRQFSPVISPNKTWAGTIGGVFLGGLVLAPLVAGLIKLDVVFTPVTYVLLAVSSVAAVYGDLFESHVKRRAGVKDMSGLLPGHGGVMDRLDSICASFVAVSLVGAFLQVVDMAAPQLQIM